MYVVILLLTVGYTSFQVTPKSSGHFVVSVYDICLDSEGPAKAQLKFTDIYSIQLSVADKVQSFFVYQAIKMKMIENYQ